MTQVRIVVVNVALTMLLACQSATAQIVNPADAQPPGTPASPPAERPHTFDMPPVTVYGKASLSDDDRIGTYAQPRWKAQRLFGETRIYVIPEGTVEFEYWLLPELHRNHEPSDFTHQFEVEFGMPYHFQLDLYAVANQTGPKGQLLFNEQKVELRWAFADWGKIPGNPTLYLEWNPRDQLPPHVEGKLLLGGQIASGWHWGSNFVFEHEAGGLQENSKEWTLGVSRVIREAKFSFGAESKLAFLSGKDPLGHRGPNDKEWGIGPSLQLRPLPAMHLDVANLFGATHDAPRAQLFVVLGWEF